MRHLKKKKEPKNPLPQKTTNATLLPVKAKLQAEKSATLE